MSAAPRCGWLYEKGAGHAGQPDLRQFLVLTEDAWNTVMNDSIVVPVYERHDVTASMLLVQVDAILWADCSRVITLDHRILGRPVRHCPQEPWVRSRIGVRTFLDIDRRIAKTPKPAGNSARTDWWPRQNDVHFVENTRIRDRKLYASISDDDWNSAPGVARSACVRLTSRTKDWRERWEVPVSGGWIVCGDIYQLRHADFEQSAPPETYPSAITDAESTSLAVKQKTSLTLK